MKVNRKKVVLSAASLLCVVSQFTTLSEISFAKTVKCSDATNISFIDRVKYGEGADGVDDYFENRTNNGDWGDKMPHATRVEYGSIINRGESKLIWDVIGENSDETGAVGVSGPKGTVTLFLDSFSAVSLLNKYGSYSFKDVDKVPNETYDESVQHLQASDSCYKDSEPQKLLSSAFLSNLPDYQNKLVSRTLEGGSGFALSLGEGVDGEAPYTGDNIYGESVEDQYAWLLSYNEVNQLKKSVADFGQNRFYWLRTPGSLPGKAGLTSVSGIVEPSGRYVNEAKFNVGGMYYPRMAIYMKKTAFEELNVAVDTDLQNSEIIQEKVKDSKTPIVYGSYNRNPQITVGDYTFDIAGLNYEGEKLGIASNENNTATILLAGNSKKKEPYRLQKSPNILGMYTSVPYLLDYNEKLTADYATSGTRAEMENFADNFEGKLEFKPRTLKATGYDGWYSKIAKGTEGVPGNIPAENEKFWPIAYSESAQLPNQVRAFPTTYRTRTFLTSENYGSFKEQCLMEIQQVGALNYGFSQGLEGLAANRPAAYITLTKDIIKKWNQAYPAEQVKDVVKSIAPKGSDKLTLKVGSTQALSLNFDADKNADKHVTWHSENTNIATVTQKGIVQGLKQGTTKITATTGNNKKATFIVTVHNRVGVKTHVNKVLGQEATITLSYNRALDDVEKGKTSIYYSFNNGKTWKKYNKPFKQNHSFTLKTKITHFDHKNIVSSNQKVSLVQSVKTKVNAKLWSKLGHGGKYKQIAKGKNLKVDGFLKYGNKVYLNVVGSTKGFVLSSQVK